MSSMVVGSVSGPCRKSPGRRPFTSSSVYPVMRAKPSFTHSIRAWASVRITALSVRAAMSASLRASASCKRICSWACSRAALRSARLSFAERKSERCSVSSDAMRLRSS